MFSSCALGVPRPPSNKSAHPFKATSSVVMGGQECATDSERSAMTAGFTNLNRGDDSAILGGTRNTVNIDGLDSGASLIMCGEDNMLHSR